MSTAPSRSMISSRWDTTLGYHILKLSYIIPIISLMSNFSLILIVFLIFNFNVRTLKASTITECPISSIREELISDVEIDQNDELSKLNIENALSNLNINDSSAVNTVKHWSTWTYNSFPRYNIHEKKALAIVRKNLYDSLTTPSQDAVLSIVKAGMLLDAFSHISSLQQNNVRRIFLNLFNNPEHYNALFELGLIFDEIKKFNMKKIFNEKILFAVADFVEHSPPPLADSILKSLFRSFRNDAIEINDINMMPTNININTDWSKSLSSMNETVRIASQIGDKGFSQKLLSLEPNKNDELSKIHLSSNLEDQTKLRAINHFVALESLEMQDDLTNNIVKGLKSDFAKSFEGTSESTTVQVEEVGRKIDAFFTIKTMESKQNRTILFNFFDNPNFHESLSQLGEVSRLLKKFKFPRILERNILPYFVNIAKNTSERLSSTLLSDLSQRISNLVRKLNISQGKKPIHETSLEDILSEIDDNISSKISKLNLVEQFDIAKTLEKDKVKLFSTLDEVAQRKIIDNLILIKSKRSNEIINKLLEFDWFLKQSPDGQASVFFYLNYASHIAEESTSKLQQENLTNSINFILKGDIPVYAKELPRGVNGQTDTRTYINLRINNDHYSYRKIASSLPTNIYKHVALHTIAHEISHIISKVRVSTSVEYFEEEYRAWQTGFIGEFARIPNKREAAERAAFLIRNKIDDPDGVPSAYEHIEDAWELNPESFYPYLEAIGFKNPEKLTKHSYEELIEEAKKIDTDSDSPMWGWKGFETNSPKPVENKSE